MVRANGAGPTAPEGETPGRTGERPLVESTLSVAGVGLFGVGRYGRRVEPRTARRAYKQDRGLSTERLIESRPSWEDVEAFARQRIQGWFQRLLEEEGGRVVGASAARAA